MEKKNFGEQKQEDADRVQKGQKLIKSNTLKGTRSNRQEALNSSDVVSAILNSQHLLGRPSEVDVRFWAPKQIFLWRKVNCHNFKDDLNLIVSINRMLSHHHNQCQREEKGKKSDSKHIISVRV